ncbi:MAG TPA: EamA family transporter [Oligoflexia bacterium]|nr:EamA family transporter [Oligoflexia bacterium]HMP49270.1 EamA family transporter [Oligoflexia bacterium]
MSKSIKATFTGMSAVIVWGFTLPLIRYVQDILGTFYVLGLLGVLYFVSGIVINWKKLQELKPCLKVPQLYFRGIAFFCHTFFGMLALGIVQHNKIPFLVLVHYLWPTTTILCSVLIAGVKITRVFIFTIGCLLVVISLSIEILADQLSLFNNISTTDYLAFFCSFIGAISWGLYSALSKRYQATTGGGLALPFFQLSYVLFLPLSFFTNEKINFLLLPHLLLCVYAFFSFLAYRAWDLGVRKGNIVILSLFADFIPWLSLFFISLLLAIPLENKTILSAFILVVGAIITRAGTLQKNKI